LLAQLQHEEKITNLRSKITKAYFELYKPYADKGFIKIPIIDDDMQVNHHAFWVQFDTEENKDKYLKALKEFDVYAYIGYMPLHSAPMGEKYGYKPNSLPITFSAASKTARLPFYTDLPNNGLDYCIQKMQITLNKIYK